MAPSNDNPALAERPDRVSSAVRSAAITGASGFVGGLMLERLAAAGVDARGFDFATDLKRNVVAADISEPEVWMDAFDGIETIVHAAAASSIRSTREIAWRSNVIGTRNVLDAAIAGGAKRFVHLSTVRAFGDSEFPDGVTESHPVRSDGTPFTDTKIAAEQVVLQAHAAGEIDCVILRPGDVYGPGAREWTVLSVDAIRGNRFLLPAKGNGIFSPLYVTNLLDAIELAATSDAAPGQVITITDGVGVTCNDFFGHYARMLGKTRKFPWSAPTLAAVGLAALPEAAARIGGTNTDSTRANMRYLARPGTYSIAKARELLGYEPAVELEAGMRETETWLKEHGLLR